LPLQHTGLRIDRELADEIERTVIQAAQASTGFRRRLEEMQRHRVRRAATLLAQLPLFADGCGRNQLLITARWRPRRARAQPRIGGAARHPPQGPGLVSDSLPRTGLLIGIAGTLIDVRS
jgi:hypothetical protein